MSVSGVRERRRSRRIVALLRAAFAVLMVVAVFVQLAQDLVYWRGIGLHDIGLRVGNFFSAFTFEANLIGAAVLLIGAVVLWRRSGPEPRRLTVARLCVLAAIVLTGTAYNLLLRDTPVAPGSQVDWANEVVHVWAPIALIIDWLLAPGRNRVRFRVAPTVLVYPILWLIYTMIRGPLVPDELARTPYYYPYPFLDPHGPGGVGSIVTIVGVLIVFVLVLGLLAILVSRIGSRRRHTTATSR